MKIRLGRFLMLAGTVLASCIQQASGLTIENRFVRATWNESTHQLTLAHRRLGAAFAQSVIRPIDRTVARIEPVESKRFGAGQMIRILSPEGIAYRVQVYPGLPFVLIDGDLINSKAADEKRNHVPFASFEVDWGVGAKELTTFGTGGLFGADTNPGSYAWLAVVKPENKRGVVLGWVTHDRASGVMFSRVDGSKVFVDARLDYGRLTIEPGESASLETLAIGYFDDARLGLESWAEAVAALYNIDLPKQPTGYCTWYSNPHGGASDESHLAELARFAAKELAPYGFSFVQIDDKWQAGVSTNGPRRNFTTHDPQGPYPNGMRAIADKIQSVGLTPGIWFMPFAGTYYDPFFADHQSWFVKTADGRPYETEWGGTCIDMTQPAAREYLRSNVERIVGEWGFRYFKVDGLWTGSGTPLRYVNSGYQDDGIGDAVFSDPSKTNIEVFRSGLKLLREAAGPDVFILGCNAPQNMRSYGASMGLLDAMRIGPDNGPEWKQLLVGPRFGSRHYFLHGRVWYNDPDPVYVRGSMPLNHAQMICSWVAISGQLNANSDWLPGLPGKRLDILRRTMPPHGLHARPVDLFEHDPPQIWSLVDTRRQPHRYVAGLFNWDEEPRQISCPLADLNLDKNGSYVAYDFWNDEIILPIEERLTLEVPGRSCRMLSLRPCADHPQILSTSRHVTQGIVDVVEETWDVNRRTLSAKCRDIGGEEYELRLVVPNDSWIPKSVNCSDALGGSMSSTVHQEGQLVRIQFRAMKNDELNLSVRF